MAWVSSFSELNPYIGFSWSDDGQYMAFGAENFDRAEVWTVKKDGSDLKVSTDRQNAFFRCGASLYKVNLAGGPVVKLAADVSYEGLLRYSPSDRFLAHDIYREFPRVEVYDLKTGARNEISIGGLAEGQAAFLSAWSRDDLLCVSVANQSEVLTGENSSWPVAATELRIYDVGGKLVQTLRCPIGDPADRIGSFRWSNDGKILAFMAGSVITVPYTPYIAYSLVQDLRSVWTWAPSSTGNPEPDFVFDMTGKVEDVEWLDDDSGLEIWFRVPDDDDQVTTQDGVTLDLDGQAEQIRREIPWRTLGYENELGTIGEYRYFRANGGGVAALTRKGPDGKSETILQGRYLLDYAGVEHGSLWCVVSYLGFPSRARLLIYTPVR